jgi:hypothetical protein
MKDNLPLKPQLAYKVQTKSSFGSQVATIMRPTGSGLSPRSQLSLEAEGRAPLLPDGPGRRAGRGASKPKIASSSAMKNIQPMPKLSARDQDRARPATLKRFKRFARCYGSHAVYREGIVINSRQRCKEHEIERLCLP